MNQSNSFENVALNLETNKTQNFKLLLDAANFAKFLSMEYFKHYKLHKYANRIGFGPMMAKVSSPYLFKSYYNLNYIKNICNTCLWTQVHRGTS